MASAATAKSAPARRAKSEPETAELLALAESICAHYNALMSTKVYQGRSVMDAFDELTPTFRRFFVEAAKSCLVLEATARDYVVAQFAAFERYGRFSKSKYQMLPQPNQLFGLGAKTRHAEYRQNLESQQRRRPEGSTPQLREHFREQRKLDGYCRHRRLPESEVLAESPTEFTPAFLRHKGVWDIVKDLYQEQLHATV